MRFKAQCINKFLLLLLTPTFIKLCESACTTFTNTTAITKIGKIETTQILNDCSINVSIEVIKIKTCVESLHEGTFKDLPNLIDIQMVAINIKHVEPKFMENLPKLKFITITNNSIEELRRGVVSDIEVEVVDLEGNKIDRIQRAAFANLNTDILSLNSNNLRNIENGWFKNTTVNNLQICSNKIKWLGKSSFDGIKNLKYLDLFDNGMYYIQDGTFSQLKLLQLDLSENMLTRTAFLSNITTTYLHLGMNMISYMFLNSSTDITIMTIYPNPWRCECLRKLWAYTSDKRIELKEPPTYINWKDEFPVCVAEKSDCVEENGDDGVRERYFERLSFSHLQYASIFD